MGWRNWFNQKGSTLGILSCLFSSIWAFLWVLERYIGLAGTYEDVGRWQQGLITLSSMLPEWTYDLAKYVGGGACTLFVLFIATKLEGFWKGHWWFVRRGLYQFKRAIQQIGWVPVRYGMVQGDAPREEFWFDSRKMWKGKESRLIFPKYLRRGGSLCFIEFPESYKVVFLSHPMNCWFECNSPTLGYRRYKSNLPLDDHTALFIVGTDDQGTGGWSAAWMDIKRGSKAIVKGQSTF